MAGKKYDIEGARLRYKNFGGRPDNLHPQGGDRSFCLMLDDEKLLNDLTEDGLNIKYTNPRDEDDTPQPYIKVKVKYGDYPPKIYMVTKRNKTRLDEETVGELDNAEIINVDLTISLYNWNYAGKSGVTAYCDVLYATIVEDKFSDKYRFEDEEVPFN